MTVEATVEKMPRAATGSEQPFPYNIVVGVLTGEIGSKALRGTILCGPGTTVDFYPENENKDTTKDAKALCQKCDVREDCLGNALLEKDSKGVRGGYDTRERNKMLKEVRAALAS